MILAIGTKMALYVQKFGGTSVGSLERIRVVADRVIQTYQQGHQVLVVLSAMSGETDRLSHLASELSARPNRRELDMLLSTGEQVTIALLSILLNEKGFSSVSYTGGQAGIQTDDAHTKARIVTIDQQKIAADLAARKIIIVAGFQGVDLSGNITTLGRGGSDTTAVALAAALAADECQIYTDVEGVYTTDPRIEPAARCLARITCDEMLEMSSLGAKVLQLRAVEFAGKYGVPLRVCSSFSHAPGTLITYEEKTVEQPVVSAVVYNRDEARLTIRGVPDQPGVAAQILAPIADANIDVDMIIQNTAVDGLTDFSFTIHRRDYLQAREIIASVAQQLNASDVVADDKIAKLSIVGLGMRAHPGIASRMFAALAKEGINIQLVTTSEIKTSVAVDEKYIELGVRALHAAFGLGEIVSPADIAVKETGA